ncbi:hypothetical protein RO3G_06889 [Rhizopus delemar RA 99-880]|uniref:Uncharacterized protein n=1 Tax=Rhizopus delemar (strain RA 99-880 / ATCC MYA-4621 / FGSC 9543 / NRRL 43880) TaxID=246409 RepID=I1C154_RHIO9|nr:hypothetical protein RO3G_06889 [Rhizopus delemar RA 99-880]|eukprot:EIE82184.1 hypothetical protein RO3G_06889 [Rhizopus delemar RA 99-880]
MTYNFDSVYTQVLWVDETTWFKGHSKIQEGILFEQTLSMKLIVQDVVSIA